MSRSDVLLAQMSYNIAMQFQVPQNITMEDRIVGSLTPIQFTILVLGGMASFLIFTSEGIPQPVNQILGGSLGLFTVVMALGKFNDQPLYRFLKYIVGYIFTPKVRLWHKKGGGEVRLVKPNPSGMRQQSVHTVKKVSHQDIARLATILDSRGSVGAPPKVEVSTEVMPATPAQNQPEP